MDYQKALLKRLLKMIEANEKQDKLYTSIADKINDGSYTTWQEQNEKINKLTPKQKEIYFKGETIYSKSAIQRVRIELNKAMIEWEKGE